MLPIPLIPPMPPLPPIPPIPPNCRLSTWAADATAGNASKLETFIMTNRERGGFDEKEWKECGGEGLRFAEEGKARSPRPSRYSYGFDFNLLLSVILCSNIRQQSISTGRHVPCAVADSTTKKFIPKLGVVTIGQGFI